MQREWCWRCALQGPADSAAQRHDERRTVSATIVSPCGSAFVRTALAAGSSASTAETAPRHGALVVDRRNDDRSRCRGRRRRLRLRASRRGLRGLRAGSVWLMRCGACAATVRQSDTHRHTLALTDGSASHSDAMRSASQSREISCALGFFSGCGIRPAFLQRVQSRCVCSAVPGKSSAK